MEVLYTLAVILILIDYFFSVDYPAYIGYFCFAGGTFFALPLPAIPSLLLALSVWVLLLVLHTFWFRRYLTNSPNAQKVK